MNTANTPDQTEEEKIILADIQRRLCADIEAQMMCAILGRSLPCSSVYVDPGEGENYENVLTLDKLYFIAAMLKEGP